MMLYICTLNNDVSHNPIVCSIVYSILQDSYSRLVYMCVFLEFIDSRMKGAQIYVVSPNKQEECIQINYILHDTKILSIGTRAGYQISIATKVITS